MVIREGVNDKVIFGQGREGSEGTCLTDNLGKRMLVAGTASAKVRVCLGHLRGSREASVAGAESRWERRS